MIFERLIVFCTLVPEFTELVLIFGRRILGKFNFQFSQRTKPLVIRLGPVLKPFLVMLEINKVIPSAF